MVIRIAAMRLEVSYCSLRSAGYPSVLVTGPIGVGKGTVVKAVAKRCRMHVVEVSCHRNTTTHKLHAYVICIV